MATISLTPLPAAVTQLTERKVFPSGMTSRDWESEPAEVRARLFFSARVEEERILTAMHEKLKVRIDLVKSNGATMDKSRFIAEMQQLLREEGYKRPADVKRGSLRDLKGYRRLALIWDMNLAQAQGYAQWKSGMTENGLANEPCWELIRVEERVEVRDWPKVWEENGGEFYGDPGVDYPFALGRMIAPKTSEIWIEISRFGNPWPPFDWGSGMGLAGIDIDEAEALGVMGPGDKLTPQKKSFNDDVQASLKNIDEAGIESLRSDLGDAVEIKEDAISLRPSDRKESIPESLRERAREIATEGAEAFRAAKIEDIDPDETLASTTAVAVGRKLLYHAEWGARAASIGAILKKYLPSAVVVTQAEGHLYAYRPDILTLTAAEIHALSKAGENGKLLGHRANASAPGTVNISFVINGAVVVGFSAPGDRAMTFVKARRRDFTDALGKDVKILINGKEVQP